MFFSRLKKATVNFDEGLLDMIIESPVSAIGINLIGMIAKAVSFPNMINGDNISKERQ